MGVPDNQPNKELALYYQDGLLHITWADKPLAFILTYPGYCTAALLALSFLICMWRKN